MKMRLNRFLAQAGLGSRRKCDFLIQQGKVRVNGEIQTQPGKVINPEQDLVFYEERKIELPQMVYYALYKPRGYTTSLADPHATHLVSELYGNQIQERVFPVGRLDRDSEGLILLTNDGAFANYLMHPRNQIEKEYQVEIAPLKNSTPLTSSVLHTLQQGIYDGNDLLKVKKVKIIRRDSSGSLNLEITLTEGKKREIRRICSRLGWKVKKLLRIRIGQLTLGSLSPGAIRRIPSDQLPFLFGWPSKLPKQKRE